MVMIGLKDRWRIKACGCGCGGLGDFGSLVLVKFRIVGFQIANRCDFVFGFKE